MREAGKVAAIGADLGGTNIRLALVDAEGGLSEPYRYPTPSQGEAAAIVETLAQGIRVLQHQARAHGIRLVGCGLGVAGLVDARAGLVYTAPNVAGFRDLPLKKLLEEKIEVPVTLENDANAAAFAEYWLGAGRGVGSLVCLTLGTGIGSGIILGGKLLRGASGAAGEAGHMAVEANGERCGCGAQGCLEAYSSATAVLRDARAALARGEATALREKFAARPEALTAKDVSDAARAGDPVARGILERAGRYLGVGLTSLVHLLSPDLITLAGGLTAAGDLLLAPALAELARRAFPVLLRRTRVAVSALADTAGMLGAAGIVLADAGHLWMGAP
ncbi:MAG: ROK family protein [candidate division NC10 bacterium]|nr:ROK family protein [candidate division NC10 bacterium]